VVPAGSYAPRSSRETPVYRHSLIFANGGKNGGLHVFAFSGSSNLMRMVFLMLAVLPSQYQFLPFGCRQKCDATCRDWGGFSSRGLSAPVRGRVSSAAVGPLGLGLSAGLGLGFGLGAAGLGLGDIGGLGGLGAFAGAGAGRVGKDARFQPYQRKAPGPNDKITSVKVSPLPMAVSQGALPSDSLDLR
jgi:hypothetical protein